MLLQGQDKPDINTYAIERHQHSNSRNSAVLVSFWFGVGSKTRHSAHPLLQGQRIREGFQTFVVKHRR